MSIATYSPALTLLFAWALLWILMDLHYARLTPVQKWMAPLLLCILAAGNHILRLKIGAPAYGKIILLTMHLPTFLVFLRLTGCGWIKMVFMILSALVFTAPAVIASHLARFYGGSALAVLLSNLIAYAVMLLLAQFVFRKGFNDLIKYGENRLFLRFSLVPLIYYIYVFATLNVQLAATNSVSGIVAKYFPTLQALLFYFILLYDYREMRIKRELETMQTAITRELNAAEAQIALLNEAQSKTAVYQHDMRHHMIAIDSLLAAERSEQAREYIQKVRTDIEAISPKRFCENEIMNLLCSSFVEQAERMEIRLELQIKLPQELPIPDPELCSIVSNALENALHAVTCMEQPLRWITFYSEIKHNKLLMEIQNPYAGEIPMQDELPLSPQKGHGYGCCSIRSIAEKHRGLCSFEPSGGIFTLRIVLPFQMTK